MIFFVNQHSRTNQPIDQIVFEIFDFWFVIIRQLNLKTNGMHENGHIQKRKTWTGNLKPHANWINFSKSPKDKC